jgi:tubulin alpha
MDGCISNEQNPPLCFFSAGDHEKKFRPRTLFIDQDTTAIDRIKTSRMKNIYTDDQFLVSADSSDSILNKIRKEIEVYDHFQGFIFSHSTYGKCSNLSSDLLMNLKSEYSKNIILTNSIIGSSVDIVHMSNLLKYADVIIPMENKAIFDICHHQLNIQTPTFSNLNRLIALCWSNITSSMRFDGSLLSNLNEFQTSLISFPSLKLITSCLSPLIPFSYSQNADFKSPSVYDMCLPAFIQPHTCFINQINSYRTVLSVALLFRGENIIPKEIGQKLICDMKKSIRFSASSPTGLRCGINYHRPHIFDDQSDIARTDKQVLMLTNETSTSKYLCEYILNQYEKSSNTELIEAENDLQELKSNYEQFEKEILDDNQDLIMSST